MLKPYMKDDEIANSYRLAENPEAQVKVPAELNGVEPDVIRDILKERGVYTPVPRRNRRVGRPWSKEDEKWLLKLREEGKSWGEIGEALGRGKDCCQVRFYQIRVR